MTAEIKTVSLMTSVGASGVALMSANAAYQNRLRTFESQLAQHQTHVQSLAIQNQADAIVKSGQEQAHTYYAQAGQSFGGAFVEGGQAVGNAIGGKAWQQDGDGKVVPRQGALGTFARGVTHLTGGASDAKLQMESEVLAKQVNKHTDLLKQVDDRLSKPPQAGGNTAVGTGSGAGTRTLTDAENSAKNLLESKFLSANTTAGRELTQEEDAVLDMMRSTSAKDANNNLIPGKTELDIYSEKLQNKIDDQEKIISGKQSEISNIRQRRSTNGRLITDVFGGLSNTLQAGYAKEKANADANSTEWGFIKEMGSNVFGAASQAMTDCNNQTDKMIDGITGALRHAVGG